jgi:hypothetical protein
MIEHRNSGTWVLAQLAALVFASSTLAQEAPVLQGKWTATTGSRILRGAWSGQLLPGRNDAAHGSWTLENDAGDMLMQGTWSAEKSRRGWQGTWTARTAPDRIYSGTWSAFMSGTPAKTFEDMLNATLENDVAGRWRYGSSEGGWWLRSTPTK